VDPWQTLRKQLNSPKSQRAPITRKLLARKQAGKNGKKNIYTNRTTKNQFTCSLVWPAALYRQLETCSELCAYSCASVCTNLVDTLKIKQTPCSDKLQPQIWVLEWCSLVASSNFFLRQRVSTLAAHRGTCVLWRLPVRVPGTLGNTVGRAIPGCVQDCTARAAVATLRLLVEEHPHCPSGTAQSLAAAHET